MRPHKEKHYSERIGWLRAAVLGANDGIVSTASLIMGVAAAETSVSGVLIAGVAALVAGAMSMAAGEYVSVSSQADTEAADLASEKEELAQSPEHEEKELAQIYEQRGLTPTLAAQVAQQLSATDPLAAHARDELGLSEMHAARPIQAAVASAGTFALGAALPLSTAFFAPANYLMSSVAVGSLIFLALLGWLAAQAGGADKLRSMVRVAFWGALAMTLTAIVGSLFGVAA